MHRPYAGPIGINLNSTSGQAYQGGWVPTSLSGCKLWLRADKGVTLNGSRVSGWADQSGSGDAGRNMAQATAGLQPLFNASDANFGGQPTLTFAESRGDRLTSGTWSASPGSPATWLVVHRPRTVDSSGSSVLMDGDDGASGAGSRNSISIQAASSSRYVMLSSSVVQKDGGAALNRTDVLVMVFGTSARLHVNARTAVATGSSGTNTLDRLWLGSDYLASATYYYDGEIAEVIAYNRALTQGETETALIGLGVRYGITIGA